MTASSEILPVIRPLRHLKINYFLFVREFASGDRLWLTSNGGWTEHFYKQQYYQTSAFENPDEIRPPGVFPWQFLRNQEIYQDARNNFSIGSGITLVENKCVEKTDFFHFGSSTAEGDTSCYLLDNVAALSCFTKYFTNQAKSLIKMAEVNMVDVPKPATMNITPIDVTSNDISNFFKEIYLLMCLANLRLLFSKSIKE